MPSTITLQWQDPETGILQQPCLTLPVAFGAEYVQMPGMLQDQVVARRVLKAAQVAPFHCLLKAENPGVLLIDYSSGQTRVNGQGVQRRSLQPGDLIQMGTETVRVTAIAAEGASPPEPPEPLPPESVGAVMAAAAAAAQLGECDRLVGFLFKRRCGRLDPTGCPDCQGGRYRADPNYDPYYDDYAYYHRGFGNYGRGLWGHQYYVNRSHYSYNAQSRSAEFTEADAAAFETEADTDFDQYDDQFESSFDAS